MFNPFKKPQKVAQNWAETPKTLWADLVIDGMAFGQWVTDCTLADDVLTVYVRLPTSLEPQLVYEKLCQHLDKQTTIKQIDLVVDNSVADNPSKATPVRHTPSSGESGRVAPTQATLTPHPRIRHVLAIASGKGGVGKSTTTVNLALSLQKLGYRVGILDADIYGPSIPTMLGVANKKPLVENEQFVPIEVANLAMLSIGNLIDGDNTPIAWRGIKATGALMQLYQQTNWPVLDYLLIDMPPGTGDIQLTLAQRILLTGAVIVTTPQHIALLDAKKGIEMFAKTHIRVLGIVENMALHTCSQCGHREPIFGTGGGEQVAWQYEVPLLGQLPLAAAIRQGMDEGKPSALVDDEFAVYYLKIAQQIEALIGQSAQAKSNRIF